MPMRNYQTRITTKGVLSRLLEVKMTLRDVLYISYAMPYIKLQPLLPATLKPATVDGNTGFISMVVLHSTRVRLSSFPLARFTYNQFNIRTYVIDPISGQHAVYFILSGVTSRLISLATGTMGIPWQFIELIMKMDSVQGSHSLSISGNWRGYFSFKARNGTDIPDTPQYFETMESAVDFLIRPLIGFSGDTRRLVRFTIQHPQVKPEKWSLAQFQCPLFRSLVEIDDLKDPHSVYYLPAADFSISLPPSRIREKGWGEKSVDY
jgi:hypothetical protein